MFDIPNYVTLPLELGVAFLILWMDRRQRKRETDAQIRFLEQQKQARDAEIRQRERFNNWSRETSKRQIMLLESIMATLDGDKLDDFKQEVGTRYTQELNQDMEDLDELLEKQLKTEDGDPELEADIESKIDEISSAREFISNFVSNAVLDDLGHIAKSAKITYEGLRDLPKTLGNEFSDGEKVTVHVDDQDYEVDPKNQDEINEVKERLMKGYKDDKKKFFATINSSIKQTLEEVSESLNIDTGDETTNKILENVKSSILGSGGLGKMLDKAKKFSSNVKTDEKNEEESDSDNSENNDQETE